MPQIGKEEERDAHQLEYSILCGRVSVGHIDPVRQQLPVRMRQLAVGHGSVHHAVAAFARLQKHARVNDKGIGRGVDHGAAHGSHAHGAGYVEEPRRVLIQKESAAGRGNVDILRAAGQVDVAFDVGLGSVLVVSDLVGAEDVTAVAEFSHSVKCRDLACPGLPVCLPAHGHAGCLAGLRLRDRAWPPVRDRRGAGQDRPRRPHSAAAFRIVQGVTHWSTSAPS